MSARGLVVAVIVAVMGCNAPGLPAGMPPIERPDAAPDGALVEVPGDAGHLEVDLPVAPGSTGAPCDVLVYCLGRCSSGAECSAPAPALDPGWVGGVACAPVTGGPRCCAWRKMGGVECLDCGGGEVCR